VNILSIPPIVLLGDAFALAIAYISGNRQGAYGRRLRELSERPDKITVMLTTKPPNGEPLL
jgi:hypothetical protein